MVPAQQFSSRDESHHERSSEQRIAQVSFRPREAVQLGTCLRQSTSCIVVQPTHHSGSRYSGFVLFHLWVRAQKSRSDPSHACISPVVTTLLDECSMKITVLSGSQTELKARDSQHYDSASTHSESFFFAHGTHVLLPRRRFMEVK